MLDGLKRILGRPAHALVSLILNGGSSHHAVSIAELASRIPNHFEITGLEVTEISTNNEHVAGLATRDR